MYSFLLQVEKLMLSDMLQSLVAFCRQSTQVEVTRLFPLFSAYLCIYISEDTIPDLLINWFVSFYFSVLPHYLLRYFGIQVVVVIRLTCCLKPANPLLTD